MKTTLNALLIAVACSGCVAGPDEIAADKKKQEEAAPQKQPSEPKTAKSEEPAQSSVTPVSASEGKSSGFQTTNNGLKYKVIEEGTGARPNRSSTVVCNYRGWLDNGREFDSSYKRGEPAEFPLNGVIPGWTEGLQLIKEGGKIELEVPSRLGYGEQGMPPVIPPNARLHFEVELLKVK